MKVYIYGLISGDAGFNGACDFDHDDDVDGSDLAERLSVGCDFGNPLCASVFVFAHFLSDRICGSPTVHVRPALARASALGTPQLRHCNIMRQSSF